MVLNSFNNIYLNTLVLETEINFNTVLPLCKFIKNGQICPYDKDCAYRHFIKKKEKEKLCKYDCKCRFVKFGTCKFWHTLELQILNQNQNNQSNGLIINNNNLHLGSKNQMQTNINNEMNLLNNNNNNNWNSNQTYDWNPKQTFINVNQKQNQTKANLLLNTGFDNSVIINNNNSLLSNNNSFNNNNMIIQKDSSIGLNQIFQSNVGMNGLNNSSEMNQNQIKTNIINNISNEMNLLNQNQVQTNSLLDVNSNIIINAKMDQMNQKQNQRKTNFSLNTRLDVINNNSFNNNNNIGLNQTVASNVGKNQNKMQTNNWNSNQMNMNQNQSQTQTSFLLNEKNIANGKINQINTNQNQNQTQTNCLLNRNQSQMKLSKPKKIITRKTQNEIMESKEKELDNIKNQTNGLIEDVVRKEVNCNNLKIKQNNEFKEMKQMETVGNEEKEELSVVNGEHWIHLCEYWNGNIRISWHNYGYCERFENGICGYYHPPRCKDYTMENGFYCDRGDTCNYAHFAINYEINGMNVNNLNKSTNVSFNILKEELKERRNNNNFKKKKKEKWRKKNDNENINTKISDPNSGSENENESMKKGYNGNTPSMSASINDINENKNENESDEENSLSSARINKK